MKYYYVTGCDSGFGRQVTNMLSSAGHGVFAGVFLEASMEALVEEFKGNKGNVVPVRVDVTDEESVEAAAETIRRHLNAAGVAGLAGLVNNAGILVTPGPVEWTPSSAYTKMFSVNVLGMAMVTKSVLPEIRRAQGRIVNVASVAGRMGLPGQPAYCASKFAVEGYSDVLRLDMAQWGCTVHIIEPGVFPQTGLYGTWEDGYRKNWEALPPKVREDYGNTYFKHGLAGLGKALTATAKMNTDSSLVPKAMVDALTSTSPKYRYRVGFDSKWIITPVSKMHESWQDWFYLNLLGGKNPTPANAPKDGKALAKGRYAGDPAPWYVAGAIAVTVGLKAMVMSKL